MERLTCYVFSFLLCISTFSANAHVCLEHLQETAGETQEIILDENTSTCHENAYAEKNLDNTQKVSQNDCCKHTCASCLHLNTVIVTNSLFKSNGIDLLIESIQANYSNLIQLIPTPPPIT